MYLNRIFYLFSSSLVGIIYQKINQRKLYCEESNPSSSSSSLSSSSSSSSSTSSARKNNDSNSSNNDKDSLSNSISKLPIYAEIEWIVGSDPLRKGLRPIKILINESFIASAVDSIKDSHAIASSLGKELVINILHDSNSKHKLGEWLQYIFSYESVRSSTRWLVYYSLHRQDTIRMTSTLLKYQSKYWLTSKSGQPQSKGFLVMISNRFLADQENQTKIIIPLLKWTLKRQEVQDALVTVISNNLPEAKDSTVQGLTYLAKEALSSEETKKLVKDAIVQYLSDSKSLETTVEKEKGDGKTK